jgi:hypothetical protein
MAEWRYVVPQADGDDQGDPAERSQTRGACRAAQPRAAGKQGDEPEAAGGCSQRSRGGWMRSKKS